MARFDGSAVGICGYIQSCVIIRGQIYGYDRVEQISHYNEAAVDNNTLD